MSLAETIGALALALVFFFACRWGENRPRHPGRPRMLPYIPMMMILMVAILGLIAHLVALLTGRPVGGSGF